MTTDAEASLRTAEAQALLRKVSSELAGADVDTLGKLLAARREILEFLGGQSALDGDSLSSSARASEEARLPLIARRENLRAQIAQLRQTRTALQALAGRSSESGRRLDLLG